MYSMSIVTIAYNEEGNIEHVVRNTLDVLREIASEYDIIVVDDGSTDQTGVIAERLAREDPHVRVVHHDRNQGMGAAMNTGHKHTRYELVSYAVGDGQIPPSSLVALLSAIDRADVAMGMYRQRADSWRRKLMSFVWRDLFVRLLFGDFPLADGNYMFRRELLQDIDLISTTGVATIEFLYRIHKKGCTFTPVTVECLPRMSGESKVANLRTILKTIVEMIKLRVALVREGR